MPLPLELHNIAIQMGFEYVVSENDRQNRSDYWWPAQDAPNGKRFVYSVSATSAYVSGLYKRNGTQNSIAPVSNYWRFDIEAVENEEFRLLLQQCQTTQDGQMYKDGGFNIIGLTPVQFEMLLNEFLGNNRQHVYGD